MTTTTHQPAADVPRVYVCRKPIGWQATGFIAGGAVFLFMLIVMFLLRIVMLKPAPPGGEGVSEKIFPGMIGGLSVIGIGLIARGIMLLRGTRRVILDGQGINVEGFIARRRIAWREIGSLRRDKLANVFNWGTPRACVVIASQDGKTTLATIDESVEPFEELAAEIAARSSAATGRVTLDPVAQHEHEVRRASKQRRLLLILVTPMTALFAAGFVYGINEEIHTRRYATEGVTTEARVVNRRMKSVTPYVEYEFTDASGVTTHRREMMVTGATYDALAVRATVTVEYLRHNPEWNRLTGGFDTSESSFGGLFLLLSGGMTLILGTIGVFTFLGYDMKTENGKTKITRWGQPIGRAASHAEPEPPARDSFVAPVAPATPIGTQPIVPVKPVGIVALGVVAIAFGLLGVLRAAALGVLAQLGRIELGDGRVIDFDTSVWRTAWTLADGALAVALIVAGIGLVVLLRWGRSLGLIVATIQLLSTIAGLGLIVVEMVRAPEIAGAEGVRQSANSLAAIVGSLLSGVLPVVMLVVLSRRTTAESLRR